MMMSITGSFWQGYLDIGSTYDQLLFIILFLFFSYVLVYLIAECVIWPFHTNNRIVMLLYLNIIDC